jgi:septum formation protein
VPSGIEEVLAAGPPVVAVKALALAKARAVVATESHPALPTDTVVLGADTIVVIDGDVLGKPGDEAAARAMLRRLRARPHEVITGVAAVARRREEAVAVLTRVTMRDYSDADIERYLATGEPADKAGAYAVQAEGARLVARVEGCYTNVIGLPVSTTRRLLASFGVPVLPADPSAPAPVDGGERSE